MSQKVIEKDINMKYILCFMGKAGAGKDAIVRLLSMRNPSWNVVVSTTTRPPREGEVEGRDYRFVDTVTFAQQVLNGEMLEASCFNDWWYGTHTDDIKEGINLCVLNPAGCECLDDLSRTDMIPIFIHITASDKTRMLRQLNRETNPNVAEIVRRYAADENDFRFIDYNFDTLTTFENEKPEDLEKIALRVEAWAHQVK